MRIILTALDGELHGAWKDHCGSLPGVEVHRGSILDLACDAVVSPANSFGFMDGGIDALYARRFGPELQARLQALIRSKHHGELPVGLAEIVETGDGRVPYLIAAPTMRVPRILRFGVEPYLAARAALLLVLHGTFPAGAREGRPIRDVVRSIAFPGLGTGVGRIPVDLCARQMREAIEAAREPGRPFPATWQEAQRQHQELLAQASRDLQHEHPALLVDRAEQYRRRLERFRTRIRDRYRV